MARFRVYCIRDGVRYVGTLHTREHGDTCTGDGAEITRADALSALTLARAAKCNIHCTRWPFMPGLLNSTPTQD